MWIIIVAIIAGLCYAALLYLFNRKQHYGKSLTTLLFFIRAAVVALLVIVIFNPYFKNNRKIIEQSTIVIAQDNSNSLILNKDSVFYKTIYPQSLGSLIENIEENFVADAYLFGNEVREFDSLDFSDYYTDFNQILNKIKKDYYKKNVGAVVLLSDGICNRSFPPEQNIESYPFPIYTVTLGDTTAYPDMFIKDVFYNRTAQANSLFPLRIVANANNCRNREMEIKVSVNDELTEEIKVAVNSNRFSKTIDLNIDSNNEGVKQIDIQISPVENEHTAENNSKRIFVEVIDKQYKALIYAHSPHPDLGSLKNILDNNFETTTAFSYEDFPNISDFDILFLHQIPHRNMNDYHKLEDAIKTNKTIPIFFIAGKETDLDSFNALQTALTARKGAVSGTMDIKADYNQNFGLFNVENELIESVSTYPPLSLPHINISMNNNHDILLNMNINDIVMQNTPLLSFSSDNNGRKIAFLFGTGIWRWKLYEYYRENNYSNFEELFTKSVKYLLTEKDKELTINYKSSYFTNEDISFTAGIKNPSQEVSTAPNLRIRIINKHSKDFHEYDFLKGDKSYHLTVKNLPEGVYHFIAEAEHGEKKYTEEGNFSVVNIGAEAQELTADSHRMQLIANLSSGKNYNVNELDELYNALADDNRITSITREETDYISLINYKLLFFIILFLITIEWMLRKMFGTY